MATKGPIQHCEGYSSYSLHEDGSIDIDGELIAWTAGSGSSNRLAANWERYGATFLDAAKLTGLPVAWLVGLMTIESGGDPNACSPCVKELNGKQFCSFAPTCGGDCCAYGLMQFTDSTARQVSGGQVTGPMLLGKPDLAIALAAKFFAKLVEQSEGDPVVAAKRYNGCGGCKGGRAPCSGEGMLGIGGQNDYAVAFIRAANTFLALNLGPPPPVTVSSIVGDSYGVRAVGVFAMGALAVLMLDKAFDFTGKLFPGDKL